MSFPLSRPPTVTADDAAQSAERKRKKKAKQPRPTQTPDSADYRLPAYRCYHLPTHLRLPTGRPDRPPAPRSRPRGGWGAAKGQCASVKRAYVSVRRARLLARCPRPRPATAAPDAALAASPPGPCCARARRCVLDPPSARRHSSARKVHMLPPTPHPSHKSPPHSGEWPVFAHFC